MARSMASAEPDLRVGSVIATCLGAGVAAGLLVWFGLFRLATMLIGSADSAWIDNGGFGLSVSAIGVAIVLGAMLAAVHWRYRHAAGGPTLLRRLALALPLAALVALPVITAYASSKNFATNASVVAAETVMAGCLVVMGVVVACWSVSRSTVGPD